MQINRGWMIQNKEYFNFHVIHDVLSLDNMDLIGIIKDLQGKGFTWPFFSLFISQSWD